MEKIKNWKKFLLIAIPIVAIILIVIGKDGYGFGIIALICWALAFLDLARIKLGDYEIDFMNKKEALSADDKKLFIDNYDCISSFLFELRRTTHVTPEILTYIFKAYKNAQLYLPSDIVLYLKDICSKASKAADLYNQIIHTPDGSAKEKNMDEELALTLELLNIDPAAIYRKYLEISK